MNDDEITKLSVTPQLPALTEMPRPTAPQVPAFSELPLPVIAGYDVLALVGRGGMGRVYKARHQALGRIIAVKMLIDAGDDTLTARFQAESQAVARLQHPNIAQVFETGQVQGQPFLVLEFLSGGSLAQKLAGQPQDAHEAARLIELLARGMEHSHQHGVIHRDLKPANILLAADGTPKITDFGLARRLQESSGLTRTGEVLGTPSYMAPEQASGGTSQAGPAADVYALGAILYEMLTGRPPFQGPDTMQTVMMVLTLEPVAPSRLLPQLPRDLETICLKCLEKSPRKRYASAVALADDLRRFLDGRPIVARPVRWWERVFKWAKRRPAAALLVLVLFASVVALAAGFVQIRSAYAQLEESSDKLGSTNQQLKESVRETESANAKLKASIHDTQASLMLSDLAVDRMLVRLSDQLAPVPQSEHIIQESLEDARNLYERRTLIKPRDRAGISDAADALGKLGSIYSSLGRLDDAENAYRKALALHSDLNVQEPASTNHRRGCANTLLNLASLEQKRGKTIHAESLTRAALAEITPLLKEGDPLTLQSASEIHNRLGLTLQTQKKPADAQKELQAALELRKQWLAKEPDSGDAKVALASSLSNCATTMLTTDRAAEAVVALTEAEKLVAGHTSPQQRLFLGQFQANRAIAYELLKKEEDALKTHGAAIGTLTALVADYSSVPDYRFMLAKEHLNVARYVSEKGAKERRIDKTEEALRYLRIAGPILDRLVKEYPDNRAFVSQRDLCRKILGWTEEDLAKAKKKKQP
jgi:eukaryotic-like serine/threonine-protein kinase